MSVSGVLSVAIVAFVMATTGSAGVPRAQLLHTGAGVARRDAYHARRADERSVLEEVDTEAALRAETATQTIVRVEAGTIVVLLSRNSYPVRATPCRRCVRDVLVRFNCVDGLHA